MLVRSVVKIKLIDLRHKFPKWRQSQSDAPRQTTHAVEAAIDQLDRYNNSTEAIETFMKMFRCSNEEWKAAERDLANFCGCGEIFWIDDRLVMARLLNQWLNEAKSEYGECDAEMEYIQLSLLSVTEDSLRHDSHRAFFMLCGSLACLLVCSFILCIAVEVFGLKIQDNILHVGILVGTVILMVIFSNFVYGKAERDLKNFLTRVGRDKP